jgi:hypothetical protein
LVMAWPSLCLLRLGVVSALRCVVCGQRCVVCCLWCALPFTTTLNGNISPACGPTSVTVLVRTTGHTGGHSNPCLIKVTGYRTAILLYECRRLPQRSPCAFLVSPAQATLSIDLNVPVTYNSQSSSQLVRVLYSYTSMHCVTVLL